MPKNFREKREILQCEDNEVTRAFNSSRVHMHSAGMLVTTVRSSDGWMWTCQIRHFASNCFGANVRYDTKCDMMKWTGYCLTIVCTTLAAIHHGAKHSTLNKWLPVATR